MKQLIINGDDFGLHTAINQGIIDAFQNGCLTSVSLMAGGAAFEEASAYLKAHPQLGAGVHLTIVAGRAVLPAQEIASLVTDGHSFRNGHIDFLRDYCLGRIDMAELEREWTAQIKKVLAAGITPTHLDSHQHLHVVPGILSLVLKLCHRFSIRAVRIPSEPIFFLGNGAFSLGRWVGKTGLAILAEHARKEAVKQGICVPDRFWGMMDGGSLNETAVLKIIDRLDEGVHEIMTHPGADNKALETAFGWPYSWQQEKNAWVSTFVRQALEKRAIKLITFREIGS